MCTIELTLLYVYTKRPDNAGPYCWCDGRCWGHRVKVYVYLIISVLQDKQKSYVIHSLKINDIFCLGNVIRKE